MDGQLYHRWAESESERSIEKQLAHATAGDHQSICIHCLPACLLDPNNRLQSHMAKLGGDSPPSRQWQHSAAANIFNFLPFLFGE